MKTGNFVKFISKISLRNVARPLLYCEGNCFIIHFEGNCFIIHLKLCFGILFWDCRFWKIIFWEWTRWCYLVTFIILQTFGLYWTLLFLCTYNGSGFCWNYMWHIMNISQHFSLSIRDYSMWGGWSWIHNKIFWFDLRSILNWWISNDIYPPPLVKEEWRRKWHLKSPKLQDGMSDSEVYFDCGKFNVLSPAAVLQRKKERASSSQFKLQLYAIRVPWARCCFVWDELGDNTSCWARENFWVPWPEESVDWDTTWHGANEELHTGLSETWRDKH